MREIYYYRVARIKLGDQSRKEQDNKLTQGRKRQIYVFWMN